MAEDQESEFSAQLIGNISNAELDRLIAELGRHPLAEGELRKCWMDLEGIVSKRIGSRYVSGRTRAWLKIMNPDFERR